MPQRRHAVEIPTAWTHLRRPALAALAAAVTGLSLAGCANFWEDVTSRDFKFKQLFKKPDPLAVLKDSKDGDHRARAFASLKEPGPKHPQDQEFMLTMLTAAVKNEPQFYARLMAVRKLGEFKDPRATPALVEAYYAADTFPAEKATMLRCESLFGVGEVGNPAGVDLLTKVLGQGPVEGPEEDRRRALDERIAAARALGHFSPPQGTEALVQVLHKEKDTALRVAAHQSLQKSTHEKLPLDAPAWDDYLAQMKNPSDAQAKKKGVKDMMLTGFSGKP